MTHQFTLKGSERLKSRKQIQQLFKEGMALSNHPLRVVYQFESEGDSHIQAGFTVSKKYFKKAVHRNRIRRLMREAYRLQKIPLQNLLKTKNKRLSIFFIYTGKGLPDFANVYENMSRSLNQLFKLSAA